MKNLLTVLLILLSSGSYASNLCQPLLEEDVFFKEVRFNDKTGYFKLSYMYYSEYHEGLDSVKGYLKDNIWSDGWAIVEFEATGNANEYLIIYRNLPLGISVIEPVVCN